METNERSGERISAQCIRFLTPPPPPHAPSFFSIPSSSLSPPSSTNWLPGVGWFWKSSSHIHTMLHHASSKISLHKAVLTWLVDSFHGSLRACKRKNYRHYRECPHGVQSAFWLSAITAKTIVNPKQKKASKEQTRTRLKLADCLERRKKICALRFAVSSGQMVQQVF